MSTAPRPFQAPPGREYTIRELAAEFDVTARTLRFYEERGLLSPARSGQTRIFSAADRTRLKLVLRGKALGFTLDESAELITMYDPASDNEHQLQALIDKIREKKSQLQAQKQEIETLVAELDEREKLSRSALRALRRRTKEKEA